MEKQVLLFNGGLQTKLAPHLVENNMAVECINVDLDKGSIYPYKGWLYDEDTIATGIYPFFFKSQLITNSDALDRRSYATFGARLYWSNGDFTPYGLMRWNGTTAVNAVPPTVTSYGTITLTPTGTNGAMNETYSYVYTVVDTEGIESTPSPAYITSPADQNVSISISADTVTEDVLYRRIYRTGGSNPTYNLIAELNDGIMTHVDTTRDLNVSRIELTTFDNFAPPENLINLIENNGTMWASVDDRVYFSQNGQPEFWNPLDFVVLNDTCTGLGYYRDLVVAFTETSTYVISGFSRDTIAIDRLPYNEGCLNHNSIANVTEFLLWTSKNGVCLFNGDSVQVVTKNILSWYGDSVVGNLTFDSVDGTFDSNIGYNITYAVGLRGKYYAVYQDGIGVLDLSNQAIASTITLDDVASVYFDSDDNQLVGIKSDLSVHRFDYELPNLQAKWKTPEIQDEGHGIIKQFRRVKLDVTPTYVKVFVDGVYIMQSNNNRDFFIKSGAIGRTIQFEISTDVEVKSLTYEYGTM